MASGIARSPWLSTLAKTLRWSTKKLRVFLNERGYEAPYLDEARAIKILAKAGHYVTPSGLTKEPRFSKTKKPSLPQHKPEAIAKARAAWRMKLVPRLARLLPEGDSKPGMVRVRKILRQGGYEGPRWSDESRALAIFREQGISVDAFEYMDQPGGAGAGKEMVLAQKPIQITFLPRESSPPTRVPAAASRARGHGSETLGHEEALRLLGYAFTMLATYERDLMEQIRKGHISRLSAPLEVPIVVLNELRPKLKTS